MNGTSDNGANVSLTPGQLPPMASTVEDELHSRPEAADVLRAVYAEWLERRGIDPLTTPHLTMGRREFDLFRNAPPDYRNYARDIYGIPRVDQNDCQYALVEIEPDDPNLSPIPELMVVDEQDFGTTIDLETISRDFHNPDSSPDNPLTPESGGAYKTVNIESNLSEARGGLQTFAAELMKGETTDVLNSHYGDIGVRAGGLASGQKDAFVWTTSPFTKSVQLTIAFPRTYDSVCVVRGQRQEAANGKPGMAQIVDPTVVLKIEGENLRELQRVYQKLYHEPYFALTEEQRRARDEIFNNYLADQISQEAHKNRAAEQARQDDERRRRQQPQLRAREIPRR